MSVALPESTAGGVPVTGREDLPSQDDLVNGVRVGRLVTDNSPMSVFAVVFWAKTIKDEFRIKRGLAPGPAESAADRDDLPISVRSVQASTAPPDEDEDEELSAYNAYLARLNAEVKQHGRWHGWRS